MSRTWPRDTYRESGPARPSINSVTGQPWHWCQHPDRQGINGHCIGTADEPTGNKWLCEHHTTSTPVQLLLF